MRLLSTAEERRDRVDAVAVEVFSERGFYATTTTEVATAAGISQSYLYKLYPDKTSLFIAALDHGSDRLAALVSRRLRSDPDAQRALGSAVDEIAADWSLMRFLIHAVCASTEPAIREAVQRCYARQFQVIREGSSLDDEAIRRYFADSLLLNAMRAVGATELDAPWARALARS
jgi:AcrR family transcriptional regulator